MTAVTCPANDENFPTRIDRLVLAAGDTPAEIVSFPTGIGCSVLTIGDCPADIESLPVNAGALPADVDRLVLTVKSFPASLKPQKKKFCLIFAAGHQTGFIAYLSHGSENRSGVAALRELQIGLEFRHEL